MAKQITIPRLEIHNFKGIKSQVVDFHTDRPTIISGRNATGKTTIADALVWLLWGTNSSGDTASKFGIKPYGADGQPMQELDTEVEATLLITDTQTGEVQELKLKRRWVSVWRTKSGETERRFEKNKGEYFINDVPSKESDYNKAVAALIPSEVFKSITNPSYFPNLPWKEKREILMRMTTEATYKDVAVGVAEFEQMLRDLSGKTVEDFSKELGANINRISAEINGIPGLINEAQRATPITPDYVTLEAEKADLERQLEEIDNSLLTAAQASSASQEAANRIYSRLEEIQREQNRILTAARQSAYDNAERANHARRELQAKKQQLQIEWMRQVTQNGQERSRIKEQVAGIQSEIDSLTREQSRLRQQWYEEDRRTFDRGAKLVCPVTGRDCADLSACADFQANGQKLMADFNAQKVARQAEITAKGQKLGEQIAAKTEQIKQLEAMRAKLNEQDHQQKDEYDVKTAAYETAIEQMAEARPAEVKGEDLPEWQALDRERLELTAQLESTPAAATSEDFTLKKRTVMSRLDEVKRKLGLRIIIEQQEKRIAELNAQEKAMLQQRADLQKQQAIVARLTRARFDEVERRVNRLFKMVRFQMFEPTATTGDEKPNCVCWIDNVRYSDANTAAQVNAGLDIINTLCEYYHINAPVFIDGAESINEFIPTESQLVLLKVTTEDFNIQ